MFTIANKITMKYLLISIKVNMIFLVNIIRILVMKLRSAHSNEPSQYRLVRMMLGIS